MTRGRPAKAAPDYLLGIRNGDPILTGILGAVERRVGLGVDVPEVQGTRADLIVSNYIKISTVVDSVGGVVYRIRFKLHQNFYCCRSFLRSIIY